MKEPDVTYHMNLVIHDKPGGWIEIMSNVHCKLLYPVEHQAILQGWNFELRLCRVQSIELSRNHLSDTVPMNKVIVNWDVLLERIQKEQKERERMLEEYYQEIKKKIPEDALRFAEIINHVKSVWS